LKNSPRPPDRPGLSAHGARAAVRLSDEYFLRALRIVADLTEGDMITAIVFRAVVAGNIGYLDSHTAEAALYADLETVPPCADRSVFCRFPERWGCPMRQHAGTFAS